MTQEKDPTFEEWVEKFIKVYLMRKNNPEEFEKYKTSDGVYDISKPVCPEIL